MYSFLKSIHNIVGMAVLLILLVAVVYILLRLLGKKSFDKRSKSFSLIGMISVHLQIVFGIILYLVSPYGVGNFSGEAMGDTVSRFYLVEHPVGMILAAVLVTIGYRKVKNTNLSDSKKLQQVLIYYGIALAITSYFIPWFIWS